MANAHKGQVKFKAGDADYTLSFSADALAELEGVLGMTVKQASKILNDPETFNLKLLRTVFWAGLLDMHDGKFEQDAVRPILRHVGTEEASELVGKAFEASFPKSAAAAAAAEGGAAPDPQQPAAPVPATPATSGIGQSS